jgi:site-specific DNA recombinase
VVLLIEELARHHVAVIFIKAPHSGTPEDQLLLQFQGMIAEYERAQILERSRRGKLHRARQGEISVLSGAPYGYRYERKSDEQAAGYTVIDAEAQVVRQIYELYTVTGLSIGAVTRRLNELAIPTKKGAARWERSTVWAILRNPAYGGMACFGKTQQAVRERTNNRTLRQRGGLPARNSANHELPPDQWIQIPVPALLDPDTFALAQERLENNKKHASRRTIEPSILQGLVHCRECGYALYRTSTRSSARKISYYRCQGTDAWRYDGHAKCEQRSIRLDLLGHIVWSEIVRLLEDPALIQTELNRRLDTARNSSPTKRQQDNVTQDLAQVQKRMDRLLTAYQEDLFSLNELRRRMPAMRQREQRLQDELRSLSAQLVDQAAYLRLAETLTAFLERLRSHAETLEVQDRQRITRLLVKEVVVDDDSITIRHSIPTAARSAGGSGGPSRPLGSSQSPHADQSYLLRPWRGQSNRDESVHALRVR